MEILLALVERAGQTVTKQDLLARAWPDTFVDDANLRVHVAALRKVLSDGHDGTRYIANVMGRGYCFVAPVSQGGARRRCRAAPAHATVRHNLPALLTRVLGRADAIEAVALQVSMRRCVTITGPGGIGKTTVAIAAAEKLLPVYDDGVWFIDLAVDHGPSADRLRHRVGAGVLRRRGQPRCQPGRIPERQTDAAGARQLRAHGRCGGAAAGDHSAPGAQCQLPGDQPRGAARRGRMGLSAQADRDAARDRYVDRGGGAEVRRGPALRRARLGEHGRISPCRMPTRRSLPASAAISTGCRWRSNSPRRASTCSVCADWRRC